MNDYLNAVSEIQAKTFSAEVVSIKTKFQLGDPVCTNQYIRRRFLQIYTNMKDDGQWEKELDEHTQIIALQTSVNRLESKLNDRIALATLDGKKSGDGAATDAGGSSGRRGKRSHYKA